MSLRALGDGLEKMSAAAERRQNDAERLCLKSTSLSGPRSGPNENSPALQRWDRDRNDPEVREADG